VAAEAVIEFIVGLAAMAIITGRDVVKTAWFMAFVTIYAGDFCFVGAALGLNIHRLYLMAFDAVIVIELVSGCQYRGGYYHNY
jgi:hypothetical protein